MARFLDMNEIRNFDVNGQTFDLLALIEALPRTPEGWVHPESVKELHVGQIVHVWALGDRLRRGVVIKLGRTKVSVAFTTQGAVDEAVRYRGGKDIRVADSAVQLSQINIPAAPAPVEVETEEAPEVETPAALTEAQIEENSAESEALNLADAEAARTENEAPGGIYYGTEWASSPAVEIDETEKLTLTSHGGKVDLNTENDGGEADMTSTDTQNTTREMTGSAVVKLLERVHDRIRQNHPEVPEVVIVTGAGIGFGGGKWGHFRPQGWTAQNGEDKATHIHEMFMAGETLAKGSRQVLQTMLHESAHALAEHRGEKDTSRQGRWHNQVFRKTAQELGLEYKGEKADKTLGFSQVTLTAETVEEYKDLLDALDAEIHLMVRLPGWLGGTSGNDEDDENNGGENMGKAPKTGPATSSNNVKLTCECEEPNIIRASKKVAAKMVVRCDDCESLFAERD